MINPNDPVVQMLKTIVSERDQAFAALTKEVEEVGDALELMIKHVQTIVTSFNNRITAIEKALGGDNGLSETVEINPD